MYLWNYSKLLKQIYRTAEYPHAVYTFARLHYVLWKFVIDYAAGWTWDILLNVSLWSVNLGDLCNAAESFCNILQSLQPALWSNIKCFRVFPVKYIQNKRCATIIMFVITF